MSAAILRFRQAGQGDIPALLALVESAYRGDSSRKGWTTEADLLDGQRTDVAGIEATLARPGSLVAVAEGDGELLACAHLERQGADAYFGMFAVRPSLQGAGIGHAMLAQCESIARTEWQARAMRMTVIWTRRELIDWYRRRGYQETGETRPFPYGDARFGLPKREDLFFVVLEKGLAEAPGGGVEGTRPRGHEGR